MTDEAKALVERLRWSHWYYEDAGENTSYTSEAPLEAADLIETQAREIERLKAEVMRQMQWKTEAQNDADEMAAALDNIANESSDTWAREKARAALAGDSHDQ